MYQRKNFFAEDDDPSEKVVSEETEKLVADLKKMIQEVETTMKPDDEEDESTMRKIRKNRNRQRRKRKVPNPVKAVPGMILNFYNFIS